MAELVGRRVGVMGGTMVRGDMGGEAGGVVGKDMEVVGQEADKGLQESLRRQLKARQCQQIERRGERFL